MIISFLRLGSLMKTFVRWSLVAIALTVGTVSLTGCGGSGNKMDDKKGETKMMDGKMDNKMNDGKMMDGKMGDGKMMDDKKMDNKMDEGKMK
jgi:hypothetical protein